MVPLGQDVIELLAESAPDQAYSTEYIKALHLCVDSLSPAAKRVIKLRYNEGMKPSRIAEDLQLSPATIYEARDHYWHLVMLEGHLADLPGWIAGQQYATQLAFSETLEAFIEMESNAEAQLQTYPTDGTDAERKRAHDEPITWQDVRMVGVLCIKALARQRLACDALTAAVICIAALAYATWFGGSAKQTPIEPITGTNLQTPPIASVQIAPAPVAVIMNLTSVSDGTSDIDWPLGTELAQGEVIALQAGSALELAYRSGTSVILQGPGEFELHSPERVGMTKGRINAQVPPQAKGFTVSTAQTDFIDHGTEFIVTVDQEGRGEVVVLDGLIEARPTNPQALPSLSQPESIMLHEGFGGRIVPDEALPQSVQPVDEAHFVHHTRSWDDVVYRPRLSGSISYASPPPASLLLNEASSVDPILIPERRGVVLSEDLHLNSNNSNSLILKKQGIRLTYDQDYVIPAGTKVNSFLIHFDLDKDNSEGVVERDFMLQFNGRIVGIIEMQKYQVITDKLFGLDAIQYPETGMLRGASDPRGHPNHDYLQLSDDRRTLSVKMRLTGMDQIRVLADRTAAQPADSPEVVHLSAGVHKIDAVDNKVYKLTGKSRLGLQSKDVPIRQGAVHLNAEDTVLVFTHLLPSQVKTTSLKYLRVNGEPAVLGQNIRLVRAVNSTVVQPHGRDYQPLQTFNQTRYRGEARAYNLYTYYRSEQLAEDEDKIASFTLKQGYMATLAENEDGTGASQVFIANEGDLRVPALPYKLRGKVSFIRVFPWRWTGKKGYGGKQAPAELLDVQWRYNWGAGDESTLDMEYVLMKHNANWPSWRQINEKQGVTHLLGFNEPMQKDQANMKMEQVLRLWPKLQASGLRLGSPCTTDGTIEWLYEFMDKAKARGYRVDFITVHYYKGGWSDEKFMRWMRDIHERTGLPLWVTEFNNGARWVKGHNPSLQQNAKAISRYCKIMDECDFIERYAVFNMKDNRAVIADGQLTPAGKRYRNNPSAEAYQETKE
eukprot:g12426.t1